MSSQAPERQSSNGTDPPKDRGLLARLLGSVSSIRNKIIVPYVLLTLIVAALGIFIVTSLLAGTIEERFTNQLLEAGRVAADGLVRQEQDQLAVIRQMAQTIGVAQATVERDSAALRSLLEVQAYNANIDSLIVLTPTGDSLLTLQAVRRSNINLIDEYQATDAGNLASWSVVGPVLSGVTDERGDKFAGLVDTPAGLQLFTSAPLYVAMEDESEASQLVGVLLIGNAMERVLVDLKSESLADLALYLGNAENAALVGSTIPNWQIEPQSTVLMIDPALYAETLENSEQTAIRALTLFEREYRSALAPLVIRGQAVGVRGVLLPSSFVVQAVSTSRDTFILVFTVATLATVLVGYLVAQRIVRPIMDLQRLSAAVGAGDLQARAEIIPNDEIGELALSFNKMTADLFRAQGDLKREIARTQAILRSIADGVFVINIDRAIMMTNPTADQILADHGGGDLIDLILSQDLSEDQRIESNGRYYSVSLAPVFVEMHDRRSAQTEHYSDVLVLHDVTRETLAERTKTSLIDSITHELRTPLTGLKGYAEIIYHKNDMLSPEKRNKLMASLLERAETLNRLVNQMVTLTRIGSGDVGLHFEQVDINQLVNTLLRTWKDDLRAARLNPVTLLPAEPVVVRADSEQLLRALDQILTNACRYSPLGGDLKLRVEAEGPQVCLSISDPGVGISSDDLPQIFDQFYRGSPIDQDGNLIDIRGMGQGLFLVKTIVEAHNGQVSALSSPGEGSTFLICLPQSGGEVEDHAAS
ncbi:MAG: HAMP domain-containing protein [Chloroflexi bacterium]|nr:HAMP domain-containing protein [Chloroflexota bacterium]